MIVGTSLKITAEIIQEMSSTVANVDPDAVEMLVDELEKARNIFCLGAGRSGILLQAFCMRLNHLGFSAYLAGGLPCPPASHEDLIVVVSGSGSSPSVSAIVAQGRAAHAKVVVFTAQEHERPETIMGADRTIFIPAPAALINRQSNSSRQPMRTLFEQVCFLLCESIICRLISKKGLGDEEIARRHANLE